MNKSFSLVIILMLFPYIANAQNYIGDDGSISDNPVNTFNSKAGKDSTKVNKKVPKGVKVWTIDRKYGDRTHVDRDTVQHLFMNSILTTGKYLQYNTTGVVGAPRQNRIFTDRYSYSDYLMVNSLGFFQTPIEELRFTNTLSPITNVSYNACGDKMEGEDHLNVKFAVNAGKRFGFGMKFDYIYGLGYYAHQNSAMFDWTFWSSYLGDKYQAHFAFSTDHIKLAENGGINNDEYITHPESYSENFQSSEIPTFLSQNWNRINAIHAFLTHRYNVGFSRKVPMTDEEIEARKFAIAAEKEKQERERLAEARKKGEEPAQQQQFSGRPRDAKVMGELKVDSTGVLAQDRIEVNDSILQDTIAAESLAENEDTVWLKDEFVPVTSFIHTLQIDNYSRKYQAYSTPDTLYLNRYNWSGDPAPGHIKDPLDHFNMSNIFAISMLEGFNKWAKMGIKAFARHQLERYEIPDSIYGVKSYNENSFSIGGQIVKTQGRLLHYNLGAELGVLGQRAGELKIDFDGDLNFKLFGDTTRLLLNGYFHNEKIPFMYRHYHSQHFWWDNEGFDNQLRTHLEGKVHVGVSKTTLRLAYDNIQNYAYLGVDYALNNQTHMMSKYTANVHQTGRNISVITAELYQDARLGILNWENRITYQKSTEQTILPVPTLNVWSNLYLDFKIARVLKCHFGVEGTYFTEYEAPEYCPQLMAFAVQENADVRTKIGNYPFLNVYANFVLKGCRFFVMMNHINAGSGSNKRYFTTPHYPMNARTFHIGLSWNVFN